MSTRIGIQEDRELETNIIRRAMNALFRSEEFSHNKELYEKWQYTTIGAIEVFYRKIIFHSWQCLKRNIELFTHSIDMWVPFQMFVNMNTEKFDGIQMSWAQITNLYCVRRNCDGNIIHKQDYFEYLQQHFLPVIRCKNFH